MLYNTRRLWFYSLDYDACLYTDGEDATCIDIKTERKSHTNTSHCGTVPGTYWGAVNKRAR